MAIKFDEFVRLMKATTSPVDRVALDALRAANAMISDAGQDWEGVLRRRVMFEASTAVNGPRPATGRYDDADAINPMFDRLFKTVKPSSGFYGFVQSVHEWWEENGFLTEKQYATLQRSLARDKATREDMNDEIPY